VNNCLACGQNLRFGPPDDVLFPEVRKPKWNPEASATTYTEHQELFDLKKLAFTRRISDGFFEKAMERNEIALAAYLENEFMASIRATMMGKEIPPHTITRSAPFSVDVFDSPWQHFKANHESSWWLRWLTRRRPVRTHKVTRTATFTATWEQFVGYPWQDFVSHLDSMSHRLGPAVRFSSLSADMRVDKAT
jgi:hypothetical protein